MSDEPVILTSGNANEILYKQPYLAFLDILGFSTLVQKNSHATLVDLYDNIFSETVQRVDEMIRKVSASRASKQGDKYLDPGLKIVNISDSILIWTQHGNPTALHDLVFAVSTLMGISILRGLPLRGSITRQQFSVKETGAVTSVIGKGLVHAYHLEKTQQWSGCIVDSEIINYFRSIEKVIGQREIPSPIERDNLVYEYDVPVVDGNKQLLTKKAFAVNWSEPYIDDGMIVDAFSAHNKKDDSDATKTKIQSTLNFHHFCLAKYQERQEQIKRFNEAVDKWKTE